MDSVDKNVYLSELHLFEYDNKYFVFLVRSLNLYEVDCKTYEQIKQMQKEHGEKRPVNIHDDELISAGILYESKLPLIDPSDMDSDMTRSHSKNYPITSVVLEIANDCNLNCIYCYGQGGSYGRKRELMSFEVAQKAIDFLVDNSGDSNELLVTFFGGEPLINFSVVKEVLYYCKKIEKKVNKKFLFSMTTNGTILNDEIYNFIKDNHVSVMVSIDGDRGIQNKHRCYCNGRGSFDDVKLNIPRFKEALGGHLTARATICSTDIRFNKIRNDLFKLGFTNVHTSLVDIDEDSPLFLGGDFSPLIIEQYRVLADKYVEGIIAGNVVRNDLITSKLSDLYYKRGRIRGCSAGNNNIAVGTDGNIYPCHRFMGMVQGVIGHLHTGINRELQRKYHEATVHKKEECKNCWARYLCGGTCAHTSVVHGGDIFHAPTCYCEIYCELYEIILYTYWKLKEWNDDYFRRIMEEAEDPTSD